MWYWHYLMHVNINIRTISFVEGKISIDSDEPAHLPILISVITDPLIWQMTNSHILKMDLSVIVVKFNSVYKHQKTGFPRQILTKNNAF